MANLAPLCSTVITMPITITNGRHKFDLHPKGLSGAPADAAVDLISSRGPWGRLLDLDATKNSPSSPYHIKWGEGPGLAWVQPPFSLIAAASTKSDRGARDLNGLHGCLAAMVMIITHHRHVPPCY